MISKSFDSFFSLLLLPALLLFLFPVGCAEFVRTIPDGCSVENIKESSLLDVAHVRAYRTSRILFSQQERLHRDPAGELFSPGSILSVVLAGRQSGQPQPLTLLDRDQFPFHPMGIDAYREGRDTYLLVINYAMRENVVIEKFRVEETSLHFLERYRSPLLNHPVDLVSTAPGEFVVTNYGSPSSFSALPSSLLASPSLLHYKNGRFHVALRGAPGLAGVTYDPALKRLYVASHREKGIYTLDWEKPLAEDKVGDLRKQSPSPLRFLSLDSAPAFLSLESKETLLVGSSPLLAFLLKPKYHPSPRASSEIYRVDAKTGEVNRLLGDDGTLVSGLLSVVAVNNYLYGGQLLGEGWVTCWRGGEE